MLHLLFDTGSKPSWVWGRQDHPGVIGDDRVIRGGTDDQAEAVAQQDIWDQKCTFPYPLNLSAAESVARSGEVRYGVEGMTPSTVSFIQTTAHLHVKPAQGKEIQIKDFPIGVAYAYTAGVMASYVDGILGFGQQGERDVFETAPLSKELTSRSVHMHLVEKKIIEKPEFYVHLMHPLFDDGSSFVTFGSWSHTVNPKTSISVSEGGWHSYLKSISFSRFKKDKVTKRLDPVAPTSSIAVDRPVIFDSGESSVFSMSDGSHIGYPTHLFAGTVQSYFPKDTVDMIWEKMTEMGAEVPGLCPEHLPHVLAVHFTFTDPSGKEFRITGQAERFLKTHWRSRNTAGTARRLLPIVQGDRWAILGSNFFYTFIVGFVDGRFPSVNFTPQEWKTAKPGIITVKDEGRHI
ncbi:hypothetical protein EXIGLDRAFT_760864 [Exidia glandulosa HHB12029]|uniref:Uncharacterized protein n=1 Tax=Exidia glandulosa HHB12029 TaxID=1314781 RepID=A0A165NXV0_EXIGL|nr:hypothetical protein EXIGLDRAFT_760864 [Exidia glandulosa HHB12029]